MKFEINKVNREEHLLRIALQIAGQKLRGEAANRGLSWYRDLHEFEIEDRWFGDNPVDMGTVANALEEHTGVKINFTKSNGQITVTDFEIQNQGNYNDTVGKKLAAQQFIEEESKASVSVPTWRV